MRWWLAATFALIAALTAVAVLIISSTRAERALRDNAQDFAVGNTYAAAKAVEHAQERRNLPATIAAIESNRRLAVFVYDVFGQLKSKQLSRGIEVDAIGLREQALGQALIGNTFVRPVDNGNATLVAVPIPGGRGAVLAYASRPELTAQVGVVKEKVIEAAFIGIGVGTLAGLLVAVLIAGRLRRILRTAEAIEGGDFETRLRPTFRDELGSLAATIDRMRERLRESFAQVESERDALVRLLERLHDGVIAVDQQMRVRYSNGAARRLLEAPDLARGRLAAGAVAERVVAHAHRRPLRRARPAAAGCRLARPPAHLQRRRHPGQPRLGHGRDRRRRTSPSGSAASAPSANSSRTPRTSCGRRSRRSPAPSEVLQGGAKDVPEERDRFLAHIEREAARLGRLARALLVLARAQTGEEVPLVEAVELRPLLDDVAAGVRPARRPSSSRSTARDGLAALADRDLIEQALSNLAENAIEHTEAGRDRHVAPASRPGGAVVIEVEDTGRGIPVREQERIFDRFYRGQRPRRARLRPRPRDRRARPSGRSAATARRVDRASPGPAPRVTTGRVLERAAAERRTAMSPRILVVDDDAGIRDVVTYALGREGFEIGGASDGAAALDAARKGSYDLLILDLMLPALSGIEVCRQLRAEQQDPDPDADRAGRRARPGARPRDRRRRLRDEAVLDGRS